MKNIEFKRKKGFPRAAIAIICVIVSAAVVALGFILVKKHIEKSDAKDKPHNYSFETQGFENIEDIKCLNEKMAVFTDLKSGKKGLMTLDGTVTEKAEHTAFSVCSDVWRNYRYIAESPRSEYLLTVDEETMTVTKKQYHGLTSPELIPCWSEAAKHLAWTNKTGYAGAIKPQELALADGLYPVANSLGENAKYGYIDKSLRLAIPLIFDGARDFSDGLAAVEKGGKWGYIDETGVSVLPFDFDSCAQADCMGEDCAFAFRGGLAPVCKGGKFGIINKAGETVVDFSFDRIIQGKGGVYLALSGGKWGKITVDKKFVAAETENTASGTASGEPALPKGTYMVKTSGSVLNMRADADSNSSVIAKIPNGTVLTVTKTVPGWAYCKYNSFSGWVSSDFIIQAVEASSTQAASVSAAQN